MWLSRHSRHVSCCSYVIVAMHHVALTSWSPCVMLLSRHASCGSHVIVAKRHVEERHPRGAPSVELAVFVWCGAALVKEVEGLREAQQHDAVDDGEGEHVSGYHLIDHHHERTSQLQGTAGKYKIIINHDFFPPPWRGSHIKSDNTHIIINIHPLAHFLVI